MEIIHVDSSGEYERYENLTLLKEQLEKEAEQYYISYIKLFGDLMTKAFSLKIECIALKKKIALYVSAKNTGKSITEEEILEYLKIHMAAYKVELDQMLKEREAAKQTLLVSDYTVSKIKAIYRRLAKMLHPDISPLVKQYPNLRELFNRVIMAYKLNDLKELQKLEVLINKELENNGVDHFSMVIPDISERIEELETDIDAIINTEPYSYREILESDEKTAEKKTQINDEIKTYLEYKKELEEKLCKVKEGV